MKYLKYNALLVALLAFNVVLWGQSDPCTDLNNGVQITKEELLTPEVMDFLCPPSITKETTNSTTSVTWVEPIPLTSCMPVEVIRIGGQAPGSDFEIGTHVITYQAENNCGDVVTCNFLITVTKPSTQDYKPAVIWVHGLNGGTNSWTQAANWTKENDLYHTSGFVKPVYTEKLGLQEAGESLRENMATDVVVKMLEYNADIHNLADKEKNFIIAHSQGGVVAQKMEVVIRELDHEWHNEDQNGVSKAGNYYGGLVTFGSPHQGAYITNSLTEDSDGNTVNSIAESRVGDFTDKAIDMLLPAEVEEYFKVPSYAALFGITQSSIVSRLKSVAKGIKDKVIFDLLFGSTVVNKTTKGFRVGSPELQEMNDYLGDGNLPNRIEKVAFWSEIDDESTQGELIWRTAFWLKHSPNSYDPMNAKEPPLMDGAQDANDNKAAHFASAQAAMFTAAINAWSIPGYGPVYKKWKQRADDQMQSYQWYETANDQYKTLIGAKNYFTYQNCSCYCEEVQPEDEYYISYSTELLDNCFESCSQFEYEGNLYDPYKECKKIITTGSTERISDGLILAESAKNIAGATNTSPTRLMHGSIHNQMRNDPKLELKLTRLFNGDFGEKFKIK